MNQIVDDTSSVDLDAHRFSGVVTKPLEFAVVVCPTRLRQFDLEAQAFDEAPKRWGWLVR